MTKTNDTLLKLALAAAFSLTLCVSLGCEEETTPTPAGIDEVEADRELGDGETADVDAGDTDEGVVTDPSEMDGE